MPLLFPRIARNYAKNGFYPTDEQTMTRLLPFIDTTDTGAYRVFDPCCGEGVALKEIQHHIQSRGAVCRAYGVEWDEGRARTAKGHLDRVMHGDFFQAAVDSQAFDVMLFNPPYGDLVRDSRRLTQAESRLETKFFRRSIGLLRAGGLMVLLLPRSVLNQAFAERIARSLDDIQLFKAVDPTYHQVVIVGRKVRSHTPRAAVVTAIRTVGERWDTLPVLPAAAQQPYRLPPVHADSPIKFRTIHVTPALVAEEMANHRDGLWPDFNRLFAQQDDTVPRPVMTLSDWHLAMVIVSGCVNGLVEDANGQRFLIKGHARKTIVTRQESQSYEGTDGEVITEETRRETEQYAAEIVGIDLSPGDTYGEVVVIR